MVAYPAINLHLTMNLCLHVLLGSFVMYDHLDQVSYRDGF